MANEITGQLSFNVANPSTTPGKGSFGANITYTQNAQGMVSEIFAATTSWQDLPLGSVTTLGYAVFSNLDVTNYVDIGIDVSSVFTAVLRLKAGESAVCRLTPGIVPACRAHTAGLNLFYQIYQD